MHAAVLQTATAMLGGDDDGQGSNMQDESRICCCFIGAVVGELLH
jgi:hypothetical protein